EAGRLSFKGVSQRMPVYAVVGNEVLKEADAFRKLKDGHARILDVLSEGRVPDEDMLAICTAYARELDPRLVAFYERLPERAEDFRG
ncbi:MAG: hypothetical protein LC687_00690, partial [Actinobacteria bacterium]|nr:hypothetical protein [Actinomycetota bacterium]